MKHKDKFKICKKKIEFQKKDINQINYVKEIESKLIRYNKATYYTIDRGNGIKEDICVCCWNKDHIVMPIKDNYNGYFICSNCKNTGAYDYESAKKEHYIIAQENAEHTRQIQSFLRYGNE